MHSRKKKGLAYLQRCDTRSFDKSVAVPGRLTDHFRINRWQLDLLAVKGISRDNLRKEA